MSTYPTLEQAVEAARQESAHVHAWCWNCGVVVSNGDIPFHSCTDSHTPDPHATALRAIAAAYVAVSELPASETKLVAESELKFMYEAVATGMEWKYVAETTP